ncbi:MAG: Cys-Gln thioester bond-forming surface protein, partial [Oscillospiraceae bacterium]|nr:Cys-Gln thioester bond-forming surface protein [Oscillospiraceae bacterium]
MRKKFLAFLLAVLTVVSTLAMPVSAASTREEAMRDVNVYAKDKDLNYLTMNGSVKVQHYTYYNYQSVQTGQTKEIPAYCVDPRLYGVPAKVPEGTAIRYSAESTVSDPKICGIISNGYPHMSLSDLGLQSIDEAYYATKTAVWIYLLGNWTTSGLGVNPNLSGAEREAAQRVLQATKTIYQRGMYWTELVEPQLTATPDRSTAYAATINGEECYQQVFTIDSNTWSLTPVQLSLDGGAPAGTKIISMDNDEISQIILASERTAGAGYQAKVKVVYPKSSIEGETGTCQLRLSATVVEYTLFYASTLEADKYGNLQNYILDTDPNTPANATAISSYSSDPDIPDDDPDPEPEDSTLTIYKKEEGTNKPLDGAVFRILYPDGSELGSLPTVDGRITVPITVFGNYTVTELSAPKYHLLPDVRTQNVTVTATSPGVLTFWNAPYGSLRVHKASNTGENLSGVTIQIKNLETGETQSGQTGPGDVIEFAELKPGGYEVRETAGISGWQLDGESVQTVTVVAGECSEATFINKELPGLRIIKYDRSSDKRAVMPDVTFEIWRDGTSIGKFTTDQTGEIVLTNAQPGTYVVQEVDTGDAAHLLDTTPQQIELRAGDGIRELVFFNDLKPQINRIIKVDSSDLSKPIASAKFEIKAVNGSFGPVEMTT